MGLFVEGTMVYTKDVIGKYKEVDSFCTKDMQDYEFDDNEEFVKKDDFEKILNLIESDISNIIKTIKNLEVDDAVGELNILLNKIY